MEAGVIVALVAAGTSLTVSLINGALGARNARKQADFNRELELLKAENERRAALAERQEQAAAVVDRYRQPLASAAFDLQSRLGNILEGDFLGFYAKRESDRRDAAIKTTLFRVAQYFAWAEIVRQEVQLLRFPDDAATRHVSRLLGEVRQIFNTDRLDSGLFMIWREEQRAIGELLIDPDSDRSVGYARFVQQYESLSPWWRRLEQELTTDDAPRSVRLQLAQHVLCDLVDALDPEHFQYDRSDVKRANRPLDPHAAERELNAIVGPPQETCVDRDVSA